MRRVFNKVHLVNILLLITAFVVFIIFTSFFIVGVGNNKSSNIVKNSVKNSEYSPEDELQDNISIVRYDSLPKITEIKVFITKENKVKNINLEVYVMGVVAAEMPASFGIEALKSQAVAARTYALAHVTELGGTPSKSANGANVDDTVRSQVYITKEQFVKVGSNETSNKNWNKVKGAVESTKGQVLTYKDALVMEPYYFATSSGKTENSEDVFSNSIPYLRSVDSPGEENTKNFKSSMTFRYSNLSTIINNNYNNANVTPLNLKKQITIIDRSQAGSVKNIKVGSITMTGGKFRTMLGLKSSNFKITFNSSGIQVESSGYGHDVGMSQRGADAMAQKGKSYVEILAHYYQGTALSK